MAGPAGSDTTGSRELLEEEELGAGAAAWAECAALRRSRRAFLVCEGGGPPERARLGRRSVVVILGRFWAGAEESGGGPCKGNSLRCCWLTNEQRWAFQWLRKGSPTPGRILTAQRVLVVTRSPGERTIRVFLDSIQADNSASTATESSSRLVKALRRKWRSGLPQG